METVKLCYQVPMPLTVSHEQNEPFLYIDGIKFRKMDNLSGYMEIFTRKDYEFGGLTDCVFIDVGANTADSTLYAASQEHISNVYAFEPFPQIYSLAKENIALNPTLAKKIRLQNYGWSNKKASVSVKEVDDINHSAVNTVVDEFAEQVVRDRNRLVQISLRKSSDCFEEILMKHPSQPIVLKMDIEGSEYDCFEDLDEQNLFEKIDVIIMEWHLKGFRPLTNILDKYNYFWFNEYLSETTGLIRAYRRR